ASYEWFNAACRAEQLRPRVLLESIAPHALIALARTGHGIALINSVVRIPLEKVRAAGGLHCGKPIGRWTVAAWTRRRFLPPYAEQFAKDLVVRCRRDSPGQQWTRRAPPLPRPSGSIA